MTNGVDHERIWLQPKCCAGEYEGRQWCQDNVFDDGECEGGAKATEYVRADLAATRTPAPSSDIEEALQHIEFGMAFAYDRGLHEFGYDPVKRVRDSLLAIQGERDALAKEVYEEGVEDGIAWHCFPESGPRPTWEARAALTATG